MGISKYTSDSSSLRVRFMTISIEFLLAKWTRAASDVKRNEHMIAYL
jgi:hypothetical protein